MKKVFWAIIMFFPALLMELFSTAEYDYESPWWCYKEDFKDAFLRGKEKS